MDRALTQRLQYGGAGVFLLHLAVSCLLLNAPPDESQASTHLSPYTYLATGSGPGPVSDEVTHVDAPREAGGPSCLHPLTGTSAPAEAELRVAWFLSSMRGGKWPEAFPVGFLAAWVPGEEDAGASPSWPESASWPCVFSRHSPLGEQQTGLGAGSRTPKSAC